MDRSSLFLLIIIVCCGQSQQKALPSIVSITPNKQILKVGETATFTCTTKDSQNVPVFWRETGETKVYSIDSTVIPNGQHYNIIKETVSTHHSSHTHFKLKMWMQRTLAVINAKFLILIRPHTPVKVQNLKLLSRTRMETSIFKKVQINISKSARIQFSTAHLKT